MNSLSVTWKEYRLSPYEEGWGRFSNLVIKRDRLIARVGKVNLILPLEMEPELRQFIGKRIAILRTDIPHKQYIIRTVRLEGDEGRNQL